VSAPLVVLPAIESHGLEFDAVVVVEPAAIAAGAARNGTSSGAHGVASDGAHGVASAGSEGLSRPTTAGLRALYVALTRPTRRLAVVHSAPLPPGLELP
jgi:DNA helicase IV